MSLDPTTFLFETINFVVLAWILSRYVLGPLAAGIDARRTELARVRQEAADGLARAEAQREALDARARELDTLREEVMADAVARAAAERARILTQAREDAAAERSRAGALLEAERKAALSWVRDEAIERGPEIAGRLLMQLAPAAAHEALVVRLADAVRERADELREPVVPDEVELCVPSVPEPGLARLREVLTEALGSSPRLTVREDARLGAGASLRIGDHLLDASLQGQLELLRADARRLIEAEG